ncbi:amidohydrolase [Pseudomonas sp. Marseille-Q8238]
MSIHAPGFRDVVSLCSRHLLHLAIAGASLGLGSSALAAGSDGETLKQQVIAGVESRQKLAQVINDSLFSFAELGYQELDSTQYLTSLLEKNGFTLERNIGGMPSAWTARWGKGHPVIALGSDFDGLPGLSQKPGVAYYEPIVAGAPGHGEGHNSGLAATVVAALAVKDVLAREKLPGTLVIWPGVAEEIGGGKPYMIRAGAFKNVDAVLFSHVGSNLGSSWGQSSSNGTISVRYDFQGASAHAGVAPWLGRSALDAVEIMNVAWNFRREHLRPTQRSHYVITHGGDQPNVVPAKASVWYQIRETDFENTLKNFQIANRIADAAALATDTQVSHQVIGTAAPGHFNKALAQTLARNSERVGLPTWNDDEQRFAKAVQKLVGSPQNGLAQQQEALTPPPQRPGEGGYSDNIGDVSWAVPTAVLGYPANIPGVPFHTPAAAMSMATPIAHKGVVAGAKVLALTTLDLVRTPELLVEAKRYFTEVQNKEQKYLPFISDSDQPAVELNTEVMARFRPLLKPYHYDPTRYDTYLEQLGVSFPGLEKPTK